ncbi:MAG TPA: efflux transporter outer membrane subunit [Thermoanaerobaculia bacterium]|nr:efflux transporter outer membrane subunit [Thermoanaerobaculia bacterium]
MKRSPRGHRSESRRKAEGLAVLATLFASACAVGPAYVRPSAPVPPAFKEPPPEGWKAAEPKDEAARGEWWRVFGDPGLDALLSQVSVSNQNVVEAEAQFRAARAVARGARADLFPTLDASASVTRSKASARSGVSSGTGTTWVIPSLDASWEADVFGRIRRNVEANADAAVASAADLEAVRLAMQAELATDWFLLHGLDAQKQLLDTAVGAYETALKMTTNRHEQGVVSGVDVAQAETQLETTRAQATDILVTRQQLEHAIAVLVGKPPSELTIPPSPIGVLPPEIPLELPSELLERRPDVAGAERRVAAANARVGVAVAGFFPRLLLSASGGFSAGQLAGLFSVPNRFWSLGATALETIFDAGKRRAGMEQARASYDAAVAAYRQNVLTSMQDVEDDLAALRILELEARQLAVAVAAAERSLSIARNRYEGGITTYLEVVTAENAALANERAAIQLLSRRMTASVDLVRALGGGFHASDLPSPFGRGAVSEPAR